MKVLIKIVCVYSNISRLLSLQKQFKCYITITDADHGLSLQYTHYSVVCNHHTHMNQQRD